MSDPTTPDQEHQNWRAHNLLDLAREHGATIEPSMNVARCWAIDHGGAHSLTVYSEANNAVVVMADLPGARDWVQVTQREARNIIATGRLKPPA